MRRLSAVLVIVISFVAFAAPPDAPVPAELLGKWRASGTVGGGDGHGHGASWFLEYTFRADGTFLMTGYPPISVEGKVAVPGRDGRRLHIVLTKRKMGTSDWPDLDKWGELSADGKTLKYDEKEFQRGQ
jgi:hypothetical protein